MRQSTKSIKILGKFSFFGVFTIRGSVVVVGVSRQTSKSDGITEQKISLMDKRCENTKTPFFPSSVSLLDNIKVRNRNAARWSNRKAKVLNVFVLSFVREYLLFSPACISVYTSCPVLCQNLLYLLLSPALTFRRPFASQIATCFLWPCIVLCLFSIEFFKLCIQVHGYNFSEQS